MGEMTRRTLMSERKWRGIEEVEAEAKWLLIVTFSSWPSKTVWRRAESGKEQNVKQGQSGRRAASVPPRTKADSALTLIKQVGMQSTRG